MHAHTHSSWSRGAVEVSLDVNKSKEFGKKKKVRSLRIALYGGMYKVG